jgi:hypothetical protein
MRVQLKLIAALLLLLPATALADGELTLRGVWYKEKATRVIQPMLDATFDAGDEGVADVHVLVDAITSASAAAGAVDEPFQERRWEVGGGYMRTVGAMRLGGSARISLEPDYDSFFVGFRVERDFGDKTTTIGLGLGAGHDSISNAGAPMSIGGAAVTGTLDTLLGSISVTRVLSRNAVGAVTYDVGYLEGFQANPYRTAVTADGLVPERHPEQRLRHAIAGTLRRWFERTETTAIAVYRVYQDDWELTAHTPELRIIQQASDGVDFTMRYRYHWQDAADFFRLSYPSNDTMEFPFVTDDVKLSAFTSHTLGVKLGVRGDVIGLTGRLEELRGELVLEYIDQNNRFGNAAIAHAALTLPFEY